MRSWMSQLRAKKKLSISSAARKAGCTRGLLRLLEEEDAVTLPSLALSVASVYGMNQTQCADIGRALRNVLIECDIWAEPLDIPPEETDIRFFDRPDEQSKAH